VLSLAYFLNSFHGNHHDGEQSPPIMKGACPVLRVEYRCGRLRVRGLAPITATAS
jgi:hypothetical protein